MQSMIGKLPSMAAWMASATVARWNRLWLVPKTSRRMESQMLRYWRPLTPTVWLATTVSPMVISVRHGSPRACFWPTTVGVSNSTRWMRSEPSKRWRQALCLRRTWPHGSDSGLRQFLQLLQINDGQSVVAGSTLALADVIPSFGNLYCEGRFVSLMPALVFIETGAFQSRVLCPFLLCFSSVE